MPRWSSATNSFKTRISLLFILLFSFFVFSSSLNNYFVNLDDVSHLLGNAMIRYLDLGNVIKIFTSTVNETYIPLTTLSFAVEYHFFKFDPFVYHFDNLLLHLATTGLIFIFALRLKLTLLAASLAALLFGIHPMRVESVAWITERKDVLYAFFYMLAVISYCRFIDTKKISAYVYVIIFGLLSILSKPMALSLPLILFVIDWIKARAFTPGVFLEKIPHFLYMVPIAWITYAHHARVPGKSIAEAATIWIYSFSFYIQKFLWPVDLIPLYLLPKPIHISHQPYFIALLVFVLSIFCLIRFRKQRWFVFSFLFYFVSIFFILRFDEKADLNIVADRFMYLPSLGFCLFFGFLCHKYLHHLKLRSIFKKSLFVFCLASLMMTLSLKTIVQCAMWKDSLTLWNTVINHYTARLWNNRALGIAYLNRAVAYKDLGLAQMAFENFSEALKLKPHYWRAYLGRGHLYESLQQYDLAEHDYNRTLELKPEYADTYNKRGIMFMAVYQYKRAIEDFQRALDMDPDEPDTHVNRGVAYSAQEQYDLALADFNKALELNPHYAKGYNNRGNIYFLRGQYDLALDDLNRAINIQDDYTEAYGNRGTIYSLKGQHELALADFQKAIELSPQNTDLYNKRGQSYSLTGRNDLALADFNKVIQSNPKSSVSYLLRGDHYARMNDLQKALRDYSKVISMKPDEASAYFKRSQVYSALNESQKASEDVQKAQSLGYNVDDIYVQKIKNEE